MMKRAPITLYGFGPALGLPEVSPYVMKTEIQLKLAGVPYVKERGARETAPKGKLPYISDSGVLVADSTFIRAHIEREYDIDLDLGLCTTERSIAWMVERMLEDHLCWAMGYFRWLDPANFARGPARFFDAVPPAQRPQFLAEIQSQVRTTYQAQGIARHTPAEVADLGTRSLHSLSMLLGEKPFVMGEAPSAVDGIALGVLAGIFAPGFDSPLRRAASRLENLGDYVDRAMARFYPGHEWKPVAGRAPRSPYFAVTPIIRAVVTN